MKRKLKQIAITAAYVAGIGTGVYAEWFCLNMWPRYTGYALATMIAVTIIVGIYKYVGVSLE